MRRCVALWLCGAALYAAPALGGEFRVEYRDGLLSLKAEAATQQQILEEINRKSGGKLVIEKDAGSRPVSIAFQNVPLLQGVKRIVPHSNHVVLYDRTGAVEAIFILSDGKAAAVSKGAMVGGLAPRAGERQEILANVPEPSAGQEPVAPGPGFRPRPPETRGEGEAPAMPAATPMAEGQVPPMPNIAAETPPPGGPPPVPMAQPPASSPGTPGLPVLRPPN
jgi:hypothetical protein